MSDEVNPIQPEAPVEPTLILDPSSAISADPANEPDVEVVPVEEEPMAAAQSPVEMISMPAAPEPVASQSEPFKLRAGVNCVVDGGQVKPL